MFRPVLWFVCFSTQSQYTLLFPNTTKRCITTKMLGIEYVCVCEAMQCNVMCIKVNLNIGTPFVLYTLEVLSFVQIRVNIFIKHLIYSKAGFKYAYLLLAFCSFAFSECQWNNIFVKAFSQIVCNVRSIQFILCVFRAVDR